jgi:hypothetical protein
MMLHVGTPSMPHKYILLHSEKTCILQSRKPRPKGSKQNLQNHRASKQQSQCNPTTEIPPVTMTGLQATHALPASLNSDFSLSESKNSLFKLNQSEFFSYLQLKFLVIQYYNNNAVTLRYSNYKDQ